LTDNVVYVEESHLSIRLKMLTGMPITTIHM